MHALAFLSLVASTALVAAQQEEFARFQPLSTFGTLQARQQQQQSCASVGGKTCGAKCIRMSYTCCGNGAGACESGYTCGLAANGIYGCCPFGKRCRGDAPDPSTTDIGVARPTTVRGSGAGAGAGDDDDGADGVDGTTTRAVASTTRELTPVTTTNTPARTTAFGVDDETTSSSTVVATSRSTATTRSSAVATGPSSSSVNGSGSDGNGNGNSNSNANGSGSSTTASTGGNTPQAASAGIVSVSLASLAGGFIAAIASLL